MNLLFLDLKNAEAEKIIAFDNYSYLVRHIENGDLFVFFELKPNFSLSINFEENLHYTDMDTAYREPPLDNRYGKNRLTGWQCLAKSNNFEFVLSKRYSYKICQNGNSRIAELIKEKEITVDRVGVISIESEPYLQSFSIIFSKLSLFDSSKNMADYLNLFYSELHGNNAACSTWYFYNGLYTKLAESIIPYVREGYQISIHHSSKKELIQLYRNSNCRFLYNLLYNAVFTILKYQDSNNGLFLTTFTSSWLYKRYQISAPYIDTRLNETFTNTFSDIKQITGLFKNVDIYFNYANFLKKQYDVGNVYQSIKGVFFFDYFDIDGSIKTHTSLNHQVGIANYMLNCYKISKNKDYLIIYEKIINFIRDTYLCWVNSNGDLYYEYYVDGDHDMYSGKDYTYVTLNDLLLLFNNHKSFFSESIHELLFLITKKLNFLDLNNYGVFDPKALIPSGEGLMDKEKSKKLVIDAGLERYCSSYEYENTEYNLSYKFFRSLSDKVLNAIIKIQIVNDKDSLEFNNPRVEHWGYRLIQGDSLNRFNNRPSFSSKGYDTKNPMMLVVLDQTTNEKLAEIYIKRSSNDF